MEQKLIVTKNKLFSFFVEEYRFLLTFFLIFIICVLEFPSLSYRSEVWAEQGTDFLYNAKNLSFFKNLFKIHFAYIVLLPRFISLFVYTFFPVKYFPLVTNIAGLLFIAFFCAFFSKKKFRILIESDFIRFCICLLLGFGLTNNYENYTFINFSYYGIYFCFFMMFYDKESLSKFTFFLYAVLNALLCASKFHFIIFFIPYIILEIVSLKKKRKRDIVFFATSLFTLSLQFFVALGNRITSLSDSESKIIAELPVFIMKSFMLYIRAFTAGKSSIIYCILLVSCTCFFVYTLYKQKKFSDIQLNFFVLGNFIAFSFLAVSTLLTIFPSSGKDTVGMIFSLNTPWVASLRWVFISVELLFVMLIFAIYQYYMAKPNVLLIVLLVVLYSNNFVELKDYRPLKRDLYPKADDSRSQWNNYFTLFSYEDYFIPVNPDGWSIVKDCSHIKDIIIDGNTSFEVAIGEDISLRAIYIDYDEKINFTVEGFLKEESFLGEGKIVSNTGRNIYVLFEKRISPDYIVFKDANGIPLHLKPNTKLQIWGQKS